MAFKVKKIDIPLLYNKQFYWHVKLAPEIILTDNLDELVMEHYLASKKLASFLKEALA